MPSVNWPRLCALAEEHGVLGHLSVRIQELDKLVVPQEISETLQRQYRAQTFSTLRLSAEPFGLQERFAEGNIVRIPTPRVGLRILRRDERWAFSSAQLRTCTLHSSAQLRLPPNRTFP